MIAQPQHLKMSVEAYFALDHESRDSRYEYIDGYAYLLAGGTRYHSIISVNITSELHSLLRGSPCQVYNSDAKVRLSKSRYVYPDVTISCDERDTSDDGEIVLSPRVVVEVLSQSTEGYDRGEKFDYYRECPTIQEYVLVRTQQQAVEVYRRSTGKLWLFVPCGPGDQVELTSLNVTVPVERFYEGVRFPEQPIS